jgi:hypothetical protein
VVVCWSFLRRDCFKRKILHLSRGISLIVSGRDTDQIEAMTSSYHDRPSPMIVVQSLKVGGPNLGMLRDLQRFNHVAAFG